MEAVSTIQFRAAHSEEDALIAHHFYQLWQDNQVSEQDIDPNWQLITLEFIAQARQTASYQAFVAEVGGQIVGSASCQLFAGLYPLLFVTSYRKYGYIWGVYVESAYRRQGLATTLTKMAVEHLKNLGCTRTILHASPAGTPVYTQLGFTASNEMRLDLV
jgi:ribosomal protein S18 acetylase RimI-like enzyme